MLRASPEARRGIVLVAVKMQDGMRPSSAIHNDVLRQSDQSHP